jgi:hypothetical protein
MIKEMLAVVAAFLRAIWLYIAGVFGLIVIYFLLTRIEQGIDVVIHAGEKTGPGFWSVIAALTWAFLVWYSSRLVSYAKEHKTKGILIVFHRHFPRMLAYNCFVSIQTAIFSLRSIYNMHGIWFWLFIIGHNALYFLLTLMWDQRGKPRSMMRRSLPPIVLILTYLFLLLQSLFALSSVSNNYARRDKFNLLLLALVLFICEVLIVKLFITRRAMIDRNKKVGDQPPNDKGKLMRLIRMDQQYISAESTNFLIFNIFYLVALVLYGFVVFSIRLSDDFGPLAFVLLALGVLIGLSNLITYFSIIANFNLYVIFFAFAFIMGTFTDPYKVRLLRNEPQRPFGERLDVKSHLHEWLKNKETLIARYDSIHKFEIFIVLSDGGASRSGNWVSANLCQLEDSSRLEDSTNKFSDHILCMAGASGGTIGNCVFYSLLKGERENKLKRLLPESDLFFKGDFLTYTLGRYLGPDLFRHILPVRVVADRGAALEIAMSDGTADSMLSSYLNQPLKKIYDSSGSMPALFFNSTSVKDGMPGEISSIQLPSHSQRIDILNLLDKSAKQGNEDDMRFVTAAVMSSRFPYLSPAGNILGNYFVDGGYFDNSGAGIVLEYMENLKMILRDTTDPEIIKIKGILHFNLIHIINDPTTFDTAEKRMNPMVNDLFTPLITLANLQGASTKIADGLLNNYFKDFNKDKDTSLYQFSLYDPIQINEEPYPMSWIISDYNLYRMKMRARAEFAAKSPGIRRKIEICTSHAVR